MDGANSDAILKKRIWGLNKLICDIHNSTAYYATADVNKNITEYLDSSGTIQAHYEYSPFGKTTSKTGTMQDDFDFRFSSEVFDSETELVYYNYRYYSPVLGRWLSRDPIEERGGNNLYVMVNNRPILYWDNSGLGLLSFSSRRAELFNNAANPDHKGNLPTNYGAAIDTPKFNGGTYIGVEATAFLGTGASRVSCCFHGRIRNMTFVKYCAGAAWGASVGAGIVNMHGDKCIPEKYKGIFLEFAGPFAGFDVGYNTNLSRSGTVEGGVTSNTEWGIKVCWYILVYDDLTSECCEV